MPSDNVMIHFIDKMGVELLFVIGLLIILAYIAIKAIPAVKELRAKSIEVDKEIAEKQLELESQREKRRSEERTKDLERDRTRTEQIAQQNIILENMSRGFETQQIQLTALTTALEDSKANSRNMSETVDHTDQLVTEIHHVIVKG